MVFLEILKYTLPSLIVFLTAYFVIKQFFGHQEKKERYNMAIASREISLPLQLQAYERLVLLLERISPEGLVMRIGTGEKAAKHYQAELLKSIRTEIDHNVTQQIYVSPAAWVKVQHARAQITQLINITTRKVGEMAPADKLRHAILQELMAKKMNPATQAIEYIKAEVRKII